MNNKTAFIFDLDGVIVDTAKFHFKAWQKLANKIDVQFTHEDNEQLKGVSRVNSLEKILEWGNKSISESLFNQLMEDKNNDYLAYVSDMTEADILPGVKDFLTTLKEHKQPIALGSASKNSTTILNAINLMPFFDVIIDGNAVTKGKPDPEVFLKACAALGVSPSDAIVFEDSIAGIQAANTAGMLSIGIGDKQVLNNAKYCFSDFTEFDYSFFQNIKSNI